MCNCGNKRNGLTDQKPAAAAIQQRPRQKAPDIKFIYTGNSALAVTGNITGKRYRFNFHGEQQLIDFRDAASMMIVPVLKRV